MRGSFSSIECDLVFRVLSRYCAQLVNLLTLSLPRRMAEDGRWRGDVRPARQASRRPPPVLPRSKRNGSRSFLVSLVSDP